MIEKRQPYRNKKITQAAKGEPCLAEFPGCTGGGEDTAFRHLNEGWAGKGGSQKADDCAGFFGCQHCENLYAGLINRGWAVDEFKSDKWFYLLRAYYRTIRRLIDMGILK